MSESAQKNFRIDWPARAFEHPANGNDSNDTIHANEAVFDKTPLAIPPDQARLNLEGLKYFEIVTELSDRIAYYGDRFLASCNSKNASTYKPMHASNVGERKISAVVDVHIEIQIIWPNAQRDMRSRE
jgi:hypothetical protein